MAQGSARLLSSEELERLCNLLRNLALISIKISSNVVLWIFFKGLAQFCCFYVLQKMHTFNGDSNKMKCLAAPCTLCADNGFVFSA